MGEGDVVFLTPKTGAFLNPLVFSPSIFGDKNSGENGRKKLVGLLADVALKTYLIGGWRAIHNYMDDKNINALSRANKIMIF